SKSGSVDLAISNSRPGTVLKHQLIHPKINEVLARAGHHAKILIADGHYPASTKRGPNAELVCLNLSPGIVTASQVLRAVLSAGRTCCSRWVVELTEGAPLNP